METSMINVKKRDGSVEPLNLDKVHKMVEEACSGLSGVSASQVEMNSGIQFEDGITTEQIQEILIRSASDLITLDNPNYQFVAARLLLFGLRKQVFHKNVWKEGMPSVYDVALYNATVNKVYDEDILD
ncbi:MAG: ATP cone domain-containing protein, partial [Candidatus Nanopelagicaceae bacterium]